MKQPGFGAVAGQSKEGRFGDLEKRGTCRGKLFRLFAAGLAIFMLIGAGCAVSAQAAGQVAAFVGGQAVAIAGGQAVAIAGGEAAGRVAAFAGGQATAIAGGEAVAFASYGMEGTSTRQVRADCKKFQGLLTAVDRDSLSDASIYGLTAGQMRRVEELLASITAGSTGTEEKVQAIYGWVVSEIYYDYDEYHAGDAKDPAMQEPYEVLKSRRAMCRGFGQVFDLLLRMAGVPSVYLSGFTIHQNTGETWEAKAAGTNYHGWNAAYVEDGWYYFDATWDCANSYSGGQEIKGEPRQRYYKRTAEQMAEDHVPVAMNAAGGGSFRVDGVEYGFAGNLAMESVLIRRFPEGVGTSWRVPGSVCGYPVAGFDYEAIQDSPGWETIRTLTFRKGMTGLAEFSCYGMPSLKKVVLPEGLAEIGQAAFMDCPMLADVTLPESLLEIGSYAFANCGRLTGIVLPETLEKIGEYGFSCSGLASVALPDSVEDGGKYAFYGCTALKTLTMSRQMKNVPVGFAGYCSALTEVTLPVKASYVGKQAFVWCVSLEKVKIPNQVKKVYSNVFTNCYSLKKLTLGRQVDAVAVSALKGCVRLKSLVFLGDTPPTVTKGFYLPKSTVVTVNAGRGKAYREALGTSSYIKKHQTQIVEKRE